MRLGDRPCGRKTLTATVLSLYILLTLSLIQVLGVPYVLLSGFSDPLVLAGEILIIIGVGTARYCSLLPSQLAKKRNYVVSIFDSTGDLPFDLSPEVQQI